MNFVEKIIYSLQKTMETPETFGWFHLLWIFLSLFAIFILFLFKKKYNEKQLKIVLGTYGIIALVLELIKQIIWSFNYDLATNIVTWDYQWYAAPFQLCTTPIYVSLICLFLKDNKLRKSLLSYIAYITILGSIATVIFPENCFTSTIEINIHTMWLHYGSLVLSIYLMMNEIKPNIKNLISSFVIFIIFVTIAQYLNITIYNSGILNGETFNMFYISPYFTSELPIYDKIQQNVAYPIFLTIYIISIFIGSTIICSIHKITKKTP